MKHIIVEIFECGCCRFAEPVVRSAIGRRADRVECRYYSLPRDREVFEARNITGAADGAPQSPVVIVSDTAGEQIRLDRVNQKSVHDALERLLAN